MLHKYLPQLQSQIHTHKPQTLFINTDDKQKMPVLKIGNGKPVVLLHGFGMDAHAWLPLILGLCHQYTFYLPYLRGFSKASHMTFKQADFFAEYVADICAMREQLNLSEIAIGGISMGAMTCMALHALDKFQGITKCLLIDQGPVILHKTDWQWGLMGNHQTAFIEKLKQFYTSTAPYVDNDFDTLPQSVKLNMLDTITTMIGSSFNNKAMQYFAKFMHNYPSIAFKLRNTDGWQSQRHIVGGYLYQAYDYRKYAPNMTVPVTVVIAKQSRLYPAQGQREYANLIPNATVLEVNHAGHAVLFDQPYRSYKAIKQFLI